MTDHRQISEDDLHAFADGQLASDRTAEVERWLETHPEDAAQVAEWRAQNEAIRSAFAGTGEVRPADIAQIADHAAPRRNWRNLAAAAIILAAGFAGGYALNEFVPLREAPALMMADFPTEAGQAYLTYASEVRHAVEVGADESEHLSSWLGNRLGHSFAIPDLSADGFSLIGGRLLPLNGQPGAMLLYENEAGMRLSVMIARNDGMADSAFQWARIEDVGTYYWIDGEISYAITSRLPGEELREVTRTVYDNFGGWVP